MPALATSRALSPVLSVAMAPDSPFGMKLPSAPAGVISAEPNCDTATRPSPGQSVYWVNEPRSCETSE